jgi:TonB family protein
VAANIGNEGHNSAIKVSGTKEKGTRMVAGTKTESPGPSETLASGSTNSTAASGVPHATSSPAQSGSLLVFEKGKEIFRVPPVTEQGERSKPEDATRSASPNTNGNMEPPSEKDRTSIYALTPESASASLLHRVEPEYPQEALQQQIQGAVELDVRIGRDGTVQEIDLLSGERALANAAIAAVKQWEFRPRMVKGQSVEMQTKVTLNFRLPR